MPRTRARAPTWGDSQIAGVWTHSKGALHINVLELRAVILALHHWVTLLQGHHVLIATDNTTVVAYINKQGGTHSHLLLRLVVDLFLWLQTQDITLRARHIPGCLNVIAYRLSRPNQPIMQEWSLHPEVVESPPRSRESDIQTVGNSISGHICHSPQHASSPVHVSSSRASSTGDRCLVTGLAGEVDVHVCTVPPAQQSHSEAQDHPEGRGDTYRPLVTVTTVVSTPATTECGSPTFLSVPQRPVVTTGQYFERQVVPTARMKALMQHYQAAGFSKEVSRLTTAPRRPSTNRMYDDRWLCIANWATGKRFDPLGPTAAQIAAFLYQLFDTHDLSPQTIKGYRFCLTSVLSCTGRVAEVQAKTISDMIMSMELQRPRLTPFLPQWDLGIVLEALSKPPYKPLREASLKHLTLKTVFLLAMASGGRGSELQAFVFDPQYIQFKPKGAGVTLYFTPEFIRKNQRPNEVNDP